MTLTLILRRARRDLAILLVWLALVAFAVLLAVAQPRLLQQTVDAGARQAVASAGSNTNVLVSMTVSPHADDFPPSLNPTKISDLRAAIPGRLPPALRAVYGSSTLAVVGPQTRLAAVNGVAPTVAQPVSVQVALITPKDRAGLSVAQGTLPATAPGKPIDVVLSAANAKASGLSVGSVATVSTIPVSSAITGGDHLKLRVVGIVSEKAGTEKNWTDVGTVGTPEIPKTASSPIQITLLTDQSGLERASKAYSNSFKATVRVRLDSAKFTAAREAAVSDELAVLASHDEHLAAGLSAQVSVISQYTLALGEYPQQQRAAIAQVSIMVAGVLGVAAAVLLLVSRMLVNRRAADLSLERARGVSLPEVFWRTFAELGVVSVLGAGVGLVVARALVPGPLVQPALLVLVLLVALLAVPVQTILLVRGTWTGRRVPANRSDRLDLERRDRARRIAVELSIVALAIAAFVSLATRGLLETTTDGIDPLLASAPLLLAAVVAIVVLRIYRWPVQLASSAGRRSRGALGLLAAVRAQRSIAILPLLALSLAVALAVAGGLLATTVSAGQQTASWQRTGADVRVNTAATAEQMTAIASRPSITATALRSQAGLQLRLSTGTNFATVLSIDKSYPDFVASLPQAGASPSDVALLRKLLAASPSGGALPVVVGADLARQITDSDVGFYDGLKFIHIKVVGVTDYGPSGYLGSPFMYVNRATLAEMLGKQQTTNIVLINGPGAAHAAKTLDAPASAVHSRAGWLAARTHLALVSGVNQAIGLATLSTLLLTILALLITVLSGARERGRSLGLIRTLGLPARLGWWLALAELAPVLIASLVGGVLAGTAIVLLLEPALGLRNLSGGTANPAPQISLGFIAGLVGVAVGLLLVAVLIEIAVRRRDRLSEVLRVGETT